MAKEPLTSRRELFGVLFHGAMWSSVVSRGLGNEVQEAAPRPPFWPGYPRQDQKLVGEVVGVAHFDEKRVRELVSAYPELANAWWDWGYGDWESPLGAAAHVGERGIAEFLIEKGARIDIFAATMLGQTHVVKAFVAARPGIQRTLGPHNITLLSHAEAGGEEAKETLEYLRSLGDADSGPNTEPLPAETKQAVLGEYVSAQSDLKMVCRLNRNEQIVADFQTSQNQSNGRLMRYKGGNAFFPAGVPSVTVQFAVHDGLVTAATVSGSVPSVTLTKTQHLSLACTD